MQKNLTEGETIVVDAGCVVAMTRSVDMQVKYTGSVGRSIFGVCQNDFYDFLMAFSHVLIYTSVRFALSYSFILH